MFRETAIECHANHDLPLGKFAGARVVRKLAKQLYTFERCHDTHQPQIMHTKLNTHHCDSHVSSRCTGSCASGNQGTVANAFVRTWPTPYSADNAKRSSQALGMFRQVQHADEKSAHTGRVSTARPRASLLKPLRFRSVCNGPLHAHGSLQEHELSAPHVSCTRRNSPWLHRRTK
jgi:hypothetical protein